MTKNISDIVRRASKGLMLARLQQEVFKEALRAEEAIFAKINAIKL